MADNLAYQEKFWDELLDGKILAALSNVHQG